MMHLSTRLSPRHTRQVANLPFLNLTHAQYGHELVEIHPRLIKMLTIICFYNTLDIFKE